jgi:magnesium-transporting ATPase (P-type)
VIFNIVAQCTGDKTPADLLIFAATDLKIDNSSLTGESEPQERGPNHKGSNARPVEADNLVHVTVIPCVPTTHRKFVGLQLDSCREWRSMGGYVSGGCVSVYMRSTEC